MQENKVEIYTDGACSLNYSKSPGAWAYWIKFEDSTIFASAGGELHTTNQRMEMLACIHSLKDNKEKLKDSRAATIFTDSAYIVNCFKDRWHINWIKNGWQNAKKQPVANKDLWLELLTLVAFYNVDFIKVKGHSGNEINEVVDKLAVNYVKRLKIMIEKGEFND